MADRAITTASATRIPRETLSSPSLSEIAADPAVVQFLAENGAALDLKNKRGLTPLGAALQRQRGEGGVTIADDRREAAAQLLRKLGAPE